MLIELDVLVQQPTDKEGGACADCTGDHEVAREPLTALALLVVLGIHMNHEGRDLCDQN